MIAKNNNGITVLELLITLVITVPVILAASSMFLSTTNIIGSTIDSTQAHRNAQITLMHIQKYISNAAGAFTIVDSIDLDSDYINDVSVEYLKCPDAANIYSSPTITSRYEYLSSTNELKYYDDYSNPGQYVIISQQVANCSFDITPTDEISINVIITFLDNNNNPDNSYTLDTWIHPTATGSPTVFS